MRERFESKIMPEPMSGCWLWIGGITGAGYGAFSIDKDTQIGAHRFAWILYRGIISEGLCVLHKCDVRCCVNPDHLFLGTKETNNADCRVKGRANMRKGERHGMAKLTIEDIRAIRNSQSSLSILGQLYGVSGGHICEIKNRKVWKHVN